MARFFVPLALGAAFVSCAELRAQDTRSTTESKNQPVVDARILEPQPSGPERRFFDGVSAMIGDRAVLWSTIRDEVDARVQGIVGAGRKVAPSDVDEFRSEALRSQMFGEVLAQSARTSTSLTPEELKELVQRELQHFLDDEVIKHGSFNQYMRDLSAIGKTWVSVAEEHENELLQQLSLQDLYQRTRLQVSLLVTPREMKRYYDENKSKWIGAGSADVQRVTFASSAQDDSAQKQAAQAAAAWRADPKKTSSQVAAEFAGTALPDRKGVRNEAADSNAPFVKAFAAKAAVGEVSEPIAFGGAFWVLRIEAKTQQRNQAFGDPAVQREIVARLATQRQGEQRLRLIMRNHRNLYVFPTDILDR